MKIDLKESLNELDIISDNKYDLYNTYLSKNPSIDIKKKLVEAIYKNRTPKEVSNILNESHYEYSAYSNYEDPKDDRVEASGEEDITIHYNGDVEIYDADNFDFVKGNKYEDHFDDITVDPPYESDSYGDIYSSEFNGLKVLSKDDLIDDLIPETIYANMPEQPGVYRYSIDAVVTVDWSGLQYPEDDDYAFVEDSSECDIVDSKILNCSVTKVDNESLKNEDWDDAAWHDTADQEQVDQPDYFPDGEEESEWIEMDSKSVRDSDGFLTDYTWYWRNNNGEDQHVFVFGDSDLYGPEDGYFDWECDSLEEAQEWFENYVGPGDNEDDDWMDESLKEDFTENDLVKGKKFVNKNGVEIIITDPMKDGTVQFLFMGKDGKPEDCRSGSKKGIFNMLKKNGYSLKEDVSKEWKPNLNFKHIKDVLEKALSRGKYVNNEREEVKAALDLCDKKQKYTPEQRKFIQDSHREMWKKNRKTESLKEEDQDDIDESLSLDSMKELESNGWTVLSSGIRGGDKEYYWLARKFINGKGSWKAINDKTGEVIDISYDQALGREPINGSKGVNNLSKFLGKKLLPNRVRVEESIDDTHKDFEIARKQWNKLNTDIDFDSALDEWNKSSELAEPDTWYAKPLYSEEAWNDMVSMFSSMDESLRKKVMKVKSLNEKMAKVEPSDKELNQVINVLNKYGFKLDDNFEPGRGLFGSYHIQVINPDLKCTKESDFVRIIKNIELVGDALDDLSTDINMPITYNFGPSDGVITGGVDIHVGYKNDSID